MVYRNIQISPDFMGAMLLSHLSLVLKQVLKNFIPVQRAAVLPCSLGEYERL